MKLNFLSSAVFQGTATFTSISIKTKDLGNFEERTRKGAAIHNKVTQYVVYVSTTVVLHSNTRQFLSALGVELL